MKIVSTNPSTGEHIQEFNPSSPQEIQEKVIRAKQSFSNVWSKTNVDERVGLFKDLANLLAQQSNSLLELLQLEIGKPKGLGSFEIEDIISGIGYYTSELAKLSSQNFPIDNDSYPKTSVLLPLVPHGVVGIISPWNFPFWTPMTNIVPAILAGNTVVFKPDEHATLMGLRIKELFDHVGFPEGILNVIIGAGDVGKELVLADVDKIVLTGSVEAGKDVIINAGLCPTLLELGGNDAAIVCEDANLNQAVPAICWGAFYNAGQACNGIKRVFVHSSIAEEFINRVLEYTKNLRRGVDYGPLISQEARNIIINRVNDAVRNGAELLYGGEVKYGSGFWLDPIVLVYSRETELVIEETFGPVMPIRVFGDDKSAIYLANNTAFGLGASVWTQDIDKGKKIAMQLQAKMVCVNEALFGLPGGEYWGGWKNSGLGTTENRLSSFFKRKILISNSDLPPRGWWFPST